MISVVCGGEVRGCGVGAGVPVQGGVVEKFAKISGLCDEDSFFFRQTVLDKDSLFLFPPFFCPLSFFFTLISVRTTHIIRPKAWLWGIFSYQFRLKRSSLSLTHPRNNFFLPTPLFFSGES